MIDWWGPVLYEYYAGTEGNGSDLDHIPDNWLTHKGSGRPGGALACCTSATRTASACRSASEGLVYFERRRPVPIPQRPGQDGRGATTQHGWTTLGDVGLGRRRRATST